MPSASRVNDAINHGVTRLFPQLVTHRFLRLFTPLKTGHFGSKNDTLYLLRILKVLSGSRRCPSGSVNRAWVTHVRQPCTASCHTIPLPPATPSPVLLRLCFQWSVHQVFYLSIAIFMCLYVCFFVFLFVYVCFCACVQACEGGVQYWLLS